MCSSAMVLSRDQSQPESFMRVPFEICANAQVRKCVECSVVRNRVTAVMKAERSQERREMW